MEKADYNYEQLFLGLPTIFKDNICLIYSPKISLIFIDKFRFSYYRNLLTMENMDVIQMYKKKNIEIEESEVPEVFDYLMKSAKLNKDFYKDLQKAFYFFTQEKVEFLLEEEGEEKIVVGNFSEKKIIDKELFWDFQNTVRAHCRMDTLERPDPKEDEHPKLREWRMKREYRDWVKKNQKRKKEEDDPDYIDLMSSICALNVGITPFNIGELTLFTFYELLSRGKERDNFERDIRSLQAGADSKKLKPKFWIRKLLS